MEGSQVAWGGEGVSVSWAWRPTPCGPSEEAGCCSCRDGSRLDGGAIRGACLSAQGRNLRLQVTLVPAP